MKEAKSIALKTINLEPENEQIFFRQYVELINPMLSLSSRQLDVLGALMYQNHKLNKVFNNPEDPIKWHTLFSTNSRKEMAGYAQMESPGFNNILKVLRDKEIITFSNIKKDILLDLEDKEKFVLQFKFNIKENERSETA